jgi:ABC-2 type transport system ATP-binding protein
MAESVLQASHDVHAVKIRDLEVRRGNRLILPGISLELTGGVVTGLLGPSGCGKTTLLRAIVGVQIVTGGEIQVLGRSAGAPELRRLVAYMTQQPSVYNDLTVRENLGYYARVLDASHQEVDEVLDRLDLADRATQLVSRLSGGERSRCSLGVALLGHPQLLILDEPTVGLDPVLRRELWDTFHDLASGGVTLIVSTHVMDEADRCDDLVLMREGTVVARGSPSDLRRRTETKEIEAAFMKLATK